MIRVNALGVLELRAPGSSKEDIPAALRWRKNSALLVYLALSPNRTRTREHLCGLLWPEKPEAAARHSLNEALRTIRRALGDDSVASDPRQVRLADDAVSLDVDELEAAAAAGSRDRAAALVRGDFLEGFGIPDASAFEDWLAAQRDAWRTRSAGALVSAAEACLARGALVESRALAERALASDPYSDLAAAAVIRGAALAGDRGEALARFESWSRRLAEDLGAEPAPETQRLVDRVRRERTWHLPAAFESSASEAGRTEVVGRVNELSTILQAWQRAATGPTASLLVVTGEPGAGKTRLLEELASRARLGGGVVAAIRGVQADRAIPWSGLTGLARGGLLEAPGLFNAPPSALATFAEALPEWKARVGEEAAGAEPLAPPRAMREVLGAITEEQPLLLVVDDAQWLDAGSREGLGFSLRDLETRPLLICLAADAPAGRELFDELLPNVEPGSAATLLELSRWDEAGCAELVARTMPGFDSDAQDRLARRIFADSAGLPLLATEIVRAVRHGLEIDGEDSDAAWPATNRTLEHTLPSELPDTLRSAVRHRSRHLTSAARSLLAAAAVAGERFDADAVATRCGLDPAGRDAALDELEWHRWIQSEPRGYSFVGRIVRDIVAEDLLTPGQRRRWALGEGG